MEQFLTVGSCSVPVIIFADTGGHVLGQWGPRPSDVQAKMIRFKQENPDGEASDDQDKWKVLRQQLMETYGEGTGYQTRIVRVLKELLSSF